jgi:hypothetical protein
VSKTTEERERADLLQRRAKARKKLIEKLDAEGRDDLAIKLEKCGQPLHLACTDCYAKRTAYTRCDLRWCPACAPRLAHDRATKYQAVVETFISPLFVTFTTRNFDARNKKETGLRAVRRAFTRLRAQRWWRRCVRGGVVGFEMTRRKKGWHPHAHAILDTSWLTITTSRPPPGTSAEKFKSRARLALSEVADAWSLALGRKGTLKARAISQRLGNRTVADALRECLKYSVTADSLVNMEGKIGQFVDELTLTRTLAAFGSAYRHPALKKIKREGCPCDSCSAFGTMMPADIVESFRRKNSV